MMMEPQQNESAHTATHTSPHSNGTTDRSGYAIFCSGSPGAAHVLAHRALDEGRLEEGYHALGRCLAAIQRSDCDSEAQWVHLQWHMLVFELALGLRDDALDRLYAHIVPAISKGFALTDGPAALWRIRLSTSERPLELGMAWRHARQTALRYLEGSEDEHGVPFTLVHCFLALAGAGDTATLRRWLVRHPANGEARRFALRLMARGIAAFVEGRYAAAADLLSKALGHLRLIGGSAAQNDLFRQLRDEALTRHAHVAPVGLPERLAA
jgi:hypothetical protein